MYKRRWILYWKREQWSTLKPIYRRQSMKYLVQIDGTNPNNWRTIEATDAFSAVAKASRGPILDGHNPESAYVALGTARHPNGAPICVQSYKLTVNRETARLPAKRG